MDVLLDKNSEGTITPREKTLLKKLVAEAEALAIVNGKRLADFAQRSGAPVNAIPVTIWVAPATSAR